MPAALHENVRHFGAASLAAFLLCLLLSVPAPGCRALRAEGARGPELRLPEAGGAEAEGAQRTLRLELESLYWRGMALLEAGKEAEARRMLRQVARKAREEDVRLSAEVEHSLERLTREKAPDPTVVAPEQPTPAEPPQSAEGAPAVAGGQIGAGSEPYLPALQQPDMADKMVSVNFEKVDLRLVLKAVSDLTGANFLVDDNVRGEVTLMAPTRIPLKDLYKVLESVLAMHGYAAVPAGRWIKVLPRADATRENTLTRVGADPEAIPVDDGVVTQIIPLHYIDAADVRAWASASVGSGARVVSLPNTNAILVTSPSSQIHQLVKIIRELDRPGVEERPTIIALEHAEAAQLAQQVSKIMKEAEGKAAAKGASGAVLGRRKPARIFPDARTNSLIVIGGARETEAVRELVRRLDVERPLEAGNIHVVYLQHAQASDLVEPLSATVKAAEKATEGEGAKTPLRITADKATNSLIIAASPQEYEVIGDIIAKLDVPREQVLVEMCVAEASQDVVEELGIEWSTVDPPADSMRGFGFTNFGLRVERAAGTLEGLSVGAFKLGEEGETRVAAILKALERHSGVEILSKPHLLTSDNEEASIFAGARVPYLKQTRVTEADPATPTAIRTFEYVDVGITLNITPHISTGGIVRMLIKSEFTKIVEGRTGLSAETPTIAERNAETLVSIRSGATVVIGGLMRDDETSVRERVPVLGSLPLLGPLFRRTRTRKEKTNLLLFITPHVLTSRDDMEQMTERKKDEARESVRRLGAP